MLGWRCRTCCACTDEPCVHTGTVHCALRAHRDDIDQSAEPFAFNITIQVDDTKRTRWRVWPFVRWGWESAFPKRPEPIYPQSHARGGWED